jgi:hypothetical protein
MTILKQVLTGNIALLYDLGTAHGRHSYRSLEGFSEALSQVREGYDLVCFTSNSQPKERSYLRDLGFSMDPIQINESGNKDRMMGHFITSEAIAKSLEGVEKKVQLRKDAEKRAKEYFAGLEKGPLEVGDIMIFSKGILSRPIIYSPRNSSFAVSQILPSGRIKFRLLNNNKIPVSDEYNNHETNDGGYPAVNCYKVDCTQEEFDAKVKEFMECC